MYFYKQAITFKEACKSVLMLLVIMIVGNLPFYFLHKSGFLSETLMISLGYATSFLIIIFLFYRLTIADLRRFFSAPVPFYVIPVLILMTICMGMVIDPVTYFYHIPDWSANTFTMLSKNKALFFTGPVIVGPVLEEIIFRGVILGGLLSRYSKWQALLYSSLLFSIIHMNPLQSFGTFFLGLLMGWSYIKFRNLLFPVLIHIANNFICWYMMSYTTVSNKNSFFELFSSGQSYFMAILASFIILALSLFLLERHYRQPDEATV